MDRQALRTFEGRHVNVSLRGGDRIDDCQLVSAGHARSPAVWLFSNDADVFVALADVIDVVEAPTAGRAA